jgi:hypothetical protein
MAHNHEEEIDYESLPAGSSMAINMFAGAMVSVQFLFFPTCEIA